MSTHSTDGREWAKLSTVKAGDGLETDDGERMTVITLPSGAFAVANDDKTPLVYPFETQAEAWRFIDRHMSDPISAAEKRSDWAVEQMLKRE